ncbi:hypothetical protein EUAN_08560 [Andreesenia angusta]|uniref:DUF3277 family protein n=1 Tax=Andreesenia angusta TaxID=39480 RepID=A0A1S1V8Z9_9FIRM|nr:phage protein [Andreesenia angusta]OHW63072.1 hypothetical protein EUAN_08560 [Andreesenia angusta]
MKVYGFGDVTASFSHPKVGSKSSTGAGVGSIGVSMAGDKTAHDVGADGEVMVSKLAGKNGAITIAIQQTSELHKWLLKWYNYVESAGPLSEFANMTITIASKNLGDETVCTGVSPQKIADRSYQAQGQHVTWNLMAAEITEK